MAGMLLHIDGSKHQWFGDQRWHDLIVILDDATTEIYYAQLVEEESTRTVMEGLRTVIEAKGLFCALYSDRGSHFFLTPKAGEKVDKHRLTQVGRAMKELGIQMIPAYSPQARDRYITEFDQKFSVAAAEKGFDESLVVTWSGYLACRPNGWWARITPWRLAIGYGKSRSHSFGIRWQGVRSPFTSTWTETCHFAMARMWWDDMTPKERVWKRAAPPFEPDQFVHRSYRVA